jgi:hypothetical protein
MVRPRQFTASPYDLLRHGCLVFGAEISANAPRTPLAADIRHTEKGERQRRPLTAPRTIDHAAAPAAITAYHLRCCS